jgi:NodT family efflux transporter outer membrane factor (OMF) lipoprotein
LCGLLLCGCTLVGPDFETPEAPVEPNWYRLERDELTTTEVDLVAWWKVFDDPALDNLVATAHRQNNNLEIAALRVLEARAQLGFATGTRWPQNQIGIGDATYVSPTESTAPASSYWSYGLGLSIAWEIDFWGRFQRGIESADAALMAAMARYDDALVLLTAQVVETYALIRITEEQIRIAEQNIEIQQRSYEIVDALYRFGERGALDLQQAETLLLGTQATVPGLEASLEQIKNAMSTLLGQPPGDIDDLLGGGGLPEIPEQISVGIPADLLRRRPDVRAAEMDAMALNAQVGVATADLYPSFSLGGFLGLSSGGPGGSNSPGDLFDSASLTYNAGASFVWPFLNYGRIRNNIRVQDARLEQALVAYRETVIQAAREVEDAISELFGAEEQSRILGKAVTSANRSNDLSMLRYQEGFSDYQRVLDAQQSLFAQESRYVNSRGDAILAVVDLYKALGGGWESHAGAYEVSPETQEQMEQRTNWGKYFESEKTEASSSGGNE